MGCLRLSKLHISLTSNNLQFVLFAAVVHPILLAQVSCVDVEHLVLRLGLLLLGLIRKKKKKKLHMFSFTLCIFLSLFFFCICILHCPCCESFPMENSGSFPSRKPTAQAQPAKSIPSTDRIPTKCCQGSFPLLWVCSLTCACIQHMVPLLFPQIKD